jgi:hypothetical protein
MPQVFPELERQSRDRQGHTLIRVTLRQGVRHRVGVTRLVLHREIKAQELAIPVMLGNH